MLVPHELAHVLRRHPHVPLVNESVARPAGKNVGIPAHRAHTGTVPSHGADLLAPYRVPYLHIAEVSAHGQVLALLRPTDARDGVVRSQVAELCDLRRARTPQIDAATQPHGEHGDPVAGLVVGKKTFVITMISAALYIGAVALFIFADVL